MLLEKIGHGRKFPEKQFCFNLSNLYLRGKKNLLAYYRYSLIFCGPNVLEAKVPTQTKCFITGVLCKMQYSSNQSFQDYTIKYNLILF